MGGLVINEDFERIVKESMIDMNREAQEIVNKLISCMRIDKDRREKELKNDLVHYYRRRLGTLQISPLHENTDERLVELYVQPDMSVTGPYGKVHIGNYHELIHEKIGSKRSSKEFHEIYITSAPGFGKTSYGKRMALAWCQAHLPLEDDQTYFETSDLDEMRHFEYFFFIPMKDIKNPDCHIDDMILQEIMPDLEGGHTFTDSHFLPEILSKYHCLIFIDGLDEYKTQQQIPSKLLKRKVPRKKCTYISTTRPWELGRVAKTHIERKVEIGGLSTTSADRLIELVILKLNEIHKLERTSDDCKAQLKQRKLEEFKSTPIILLQLICLWYAGKPLGRSQCEVYSNMLELFFSRAEKKDPDMEFGNNIDQTVLPKCFEHNKNCIKNKELLMSLGKLSFDALFGGNLKSKYVLRKSEVLRYVLSEEKLQHCLNVGLLKQVNEKIPILDQEESFSFLHQTHQEFLAGLYISVQIETKNILSCICRSVADVVGMSTILTVVSGLCPVKKTNFLSCLNSVQIEDHCMKEYLGSIDHGDNVDLKRLQTVVLDCLQESQDNGHVDLKLYLECIFVSGDLYQPQHHLSNMRRILADPAHAVKAIDIVGIDHHIAGELNLETATKNIQKISISECETENLMCELINRSAESLTCLQLRTVLSNDDFLPALEKCQNLRNISFWEMQFTHNSFEKLVNVLSANKKIRQIDLRSIECEVECEGHGLDLESHTELETLYVFDTSVKFYGLNNKSLEYCDLRSFRMADTLAGILSLLENSSKLQTLICTDISSLSTLNPVLKTLVALKYLEVHLSTKELSYGDITPDSLVQISRNLMSLERVTLRHFRMTRASFSQFLENLLELKQKITVNLIDGFISVDEYNTAKEDVESHLDCKVLEASTDGKLLSFNTRERSSVPNEGMEAGVQKTEENCWRLQNFKRMLIVIFLGVVCIIGYAQFRYRGK